MKDIIKKNQVMITSLAIMIAIAGYLHFAGEVPTEDALEVNAPVLSSEQMIEDQINLDELAADYSLDSLADISDEDLEEMAQLEGLDSEVDIVLEDYLEEEMVAVIPEEGEVPGETVFTASAGINTIQEAKLVKEQTRAKSKEMLMEIIENESIDDTQKESAIQTMISMTSIAEMETGAEILLEAKGFTDSIVSISETGVDIVINAASLSDAQLAQIEDIIIRKTGVNSEEIVISTLVTQ